MYAIAIDFGGTNIKFALIQNGVVVESGRSPANSDQGLRPQLERVAQDVDQLLKSHGLTIRDCQGIGMAMPSLVNPHTLQLLSINEKYPDVANFSIADWVTETFGLPLVLENDAKAALYGEVRYGSAIGAEDAILVTFGTGIGSAAIIEGKLLRGKHHQAGCLGGHFTTNAEGAICNCGNKGCLEVYASQWALPRLAQSFPQYAQSQLATFKNMGYFHIIEASLQGDVVAKQVLDVLIEYWSAGIVNLVHAYDPEVVILSGGLMKSKAYIMPMLEQRVNRHVLTPWGQLSFVAAQDPEASVLLGLYALVEDKLQVHNKQ
jgi:glucokinase